MGVVIDEVGLVEGKEGMEGKVMGAGQEVGVGDEVVGVGHKGGGDEGGGRRRVGHCCSGG